MSQTSNDTPLHSHLLELRRRLLRAIVSIFIIFAVLFYFANDIYHLLAQPLLDHLPINTHMIATSITSPFLTPLKLTFVLSIFIAVPLLLYEVWGFIAPGLYRHERRLIAPIIFASTLLFILGMAFAYFVVFPLLFKFFVAMAPPGVTVMPDIHDYLSFTLKLFFAFGMAFEVPIAVILLVTTRVTDTENLASKRPYIVVIAFVVGMLLTPPDVISQILLAIPIWMLYEVGLVISKFVGPAPAAAQAVNSNAKP